MVAITRGFGGVQDLENFAVSSSSSLALLVRFRDSDERSKEITELGTTILSNICDAAGKLADSGADSLARMCSVVEKIAGARLLDDLLELVFVAANSPGFSAISARAWGNVLLSLRCMCRYSAGVCKRCVSNGLISALQTVLSGKDKLFRVGERSDTVDIGEGAILLLDSILPHKYLMTTMGKDPETPPLDFELYSIESDKERVFLDQGSTAQMLGEAIFPRIVQIYEDSVSQSTRFYCIQLIDKLCNLCDPVAVAKILSPQPAAQFIYDNMSSAEPLFVCFGLRMAEMVLQRLAGKEKAYLKFFQREGVLSQLRMLLDYPYLDQKYCQRPDCMWIAADNPYVQHFLACNNAERRHLGRKLGLEGRSFSGRLVNYMYNKSGQLLSTQVPASSPELRQAEEEFAAFQRTVAQLESLLRLGAAGKREDWEELFQRLAAEEALCAFTGYEARATQFVEKLFAALCIMPCDYCRPAREEAKAGDARIRSFATTQRADLEQMVMRHRAFIGAMSHSASGKSTKSAYNPHVESALEQLVKRLGSLLARTETCGISTVDQRVDAQGILPPNQATHIEPGLRARLMVLYSPTGTTIPPGAMKRLHIPSPELPEEIRKSGSKDLAVMHDLCEKVHSLVFAIERSNTVKDVERFLRKHLRTVTDIVRLKGAHYSMLMQQQNEIKEMLGEGVSLEDFLGSQEQIEEHEELVHPLTGERVPGRTVLRREESEAGVAPMRLHFEKSMSVPVAQIPEKLSRVGYRFFVGGKEVIDKSKSLFSLLGQGEAQYDVQGVLTFQIYEKKANRSVEKGADASEDDGHLYLFRDLTSEEQHVLSLCKIELDFPFPQIADPQTLATLKLLKALYLQAKTCAILHKDLANNILGSIHEDDFVNPKLEQVLRRNDILCAFSAPMNDLAKAICFRFPFVLTHKTRLTYFRMNALDRERFLVLLLQERQEGTQSREQLRLSPLKRCKLKVSRANILDCALGVMNSPPPEPRCTLEFDFDNENGSGLGPTLEFYALSAAALRAVPGLWRPMDDGTLFPAPVDPTEANAARKEERNRLFRLMGWLVARAIVDERLVDLPFSAVFWEMVLGKTLTAVDLCRIDRKNADFFSDLEKIHQRKLSIDHDTRLDPDQRKRQLNALSFDVLFSSVYPGS